MRIKGPKHPPAGPRPPPIGLTCASKGFTCAGCIHRNRRGPDAHRRPDDPHASPETTEARPRRVPPLVAYGDRTIGAEKSPFQQLVVSYDPHQRRQQETKKKLPPTFDESSINKKAGLTDPTCWWAILGSNQ